MRALGHVSGSYSCHSFPWVSNKLNEHLADQANFLSKVTCWAMVVELFEPPPGRLGTPFACLPIRPRLIQSHGFFRQGLDGQKVLADAVRTVLVRMSQMVFEQDHLLGDLTHVELRVHQRQPLPLLLLRKLGLELEGGKTTLAVCGVHQLLAGIGGKTGLNFGVPPVVVGDQEPRRTPC